MAEVKSRKVEFWTARRMSRVAIIGALAGVFALIPVPTMPGMTLDPAIPGFAAIYYGPFEAYWGYVVGQLIRQLVLSPGSFMINPLSFLLGTPFFMVVVAWIVRKIRYPWNILTAVVSGVAMHLVTYAIPGCVITYGWEAFPTCFVLQMIGCLIVMGVCLFIAFGGAAYMWRIRKQPMFPSRFIKPEENFSIASEKRIKIAAIVAIALVIIPYAFVLSPYSSSEFLGPPDSPLRKYIDAYLRLPITLGIGWFFWEIYKRHGEWFKQTE
jgi:uncharacterized membrane protein